MLERINNIKGLEIYTPAGIFVGVVDEVVIDVQGMSVAELFVVDVNPLLVDEGASIGIPFRWVQCIGDVVILHTFPRDRVELPS